jgi:colicin import membrane protein
MTVRSPSAYLVSALVHGAVVALALLLAYFSEESRQEAPKILELVAGAGDNYGATVAPALGSPGGIKLSLPAESAREAPSPIQPAPMAETLPMTKASTPKAAKSKTSGKIPNLARNFERIANRRAARLEAKYKKKLEAEERQEEAAENAERKKAAAATRIDAEGIREGVVGGSAENKTGGAGGKALTREEGDLLEAYFSLLRERFKENFVSTGEATDRLSARVQFFLAADGSISGVTIIRSSGSADFDEAVLEAFRHTTSIGPRPDGKGDTKETEFDLHQEDENQ